MVELDDDPIQDFTSPSSGSKLVPVQRAIRRAPKKRKPLNELQRNKLNAAPVDISLYKLPKPYKMSPNNKERLKTSMTCSDGFEGKEIKVTGRMMPIRTSRRYSRSIKQSFAYVPQLTLASSRDPIDHQEISQRQQGDPCQSTLNDGFENKRIDEAMNAAHPLAEASERMNRFHRPDQDQQSRRGLPPNLKDDSNTEETTLTVTSLARCRSKRRVTFSKDIEVRQTLMMISAPVAPGSPCNTDDSEDGLTDDDRSTSESSGDDKSEEEPEGDNDEHDDSGQEADSSGETEAEGGEALQNSIAAANDAFKNPGDPKASFEQSH